MRKLIFLSLLTLFLASCTAKSGENLIKAVKANDFEKVKKIVAAENVNSSDKMVADIRETKDEEDEAQKLLMKIIRQQRSKDGSCTRIKTMTQSFPEEVKKIEGEQTNNSSVGGKRSRFSILSSIEWRIGSIPEIAKNGGKTAEVTKHFFQKKQRTYDDKGNRKFFLRKRRFYK